MLGGMLLDAEWLGNKVPSTQEVLNENKNKLYTVAGFSRTIFAPVVTWAVSLSKSASNRVRNLAPPIGR